MMKYSTVDCYCPEKITKFCLKRVLVENFLVFYIFNSCYSACYNISHKKVNTYRISDFINKESEACEPVTE